MPHPMAIAALATSSTLLVAAVRDPRPPLFFLAFGILCFAAAPLVRDARSPDIWGSLFWMTAGAAHLAVFATLSQVRAADPALALLAMLGIAYLVFGTVAWVRTRFS